MTLTVTKIDDMLKKVAKSRAEAVEKNMADVIKALDADREDLLELRAIAQVASGEAAAAALGAAANDIAAILKHLQDPLLLVKPSQSGGAFVGGGGRGSGANEDSLLDETLTTPPVAVMDTPKPLPDGGPSTYVHAHKTAAKQITYTDDEGRRFIRIGGTRAWRNNNPGNLRKGTFTASNGAIGDDGSFAVFPDRETGAEAIENLLRGKIFSKLTLEAAIDRYAPPVENDTNAYLTFLVKETGIAEGTVLGDLPVSEIRKLVAGISKMEGWIEGQETSDQPATATLVKKSGAGGVSAAVGAADEWMSVARNELATAPREIAGPQAHPRILEYLMASAPWIEKSDEIAWCAGFVNFCLQQAGFSGTGHPGARSFFWNKGNKFVVLDTPRIGCIGVIRRQPFSKSTFHDKKWESGKGHVGFVVDRDDTSITLLGGNQSNTVNETKYPLEVSHDSKMVQQFVAFLMPTMN
ncbi:MAG: hypothetical protein ACJAVR_002599 [Paracoccaceae bacterium]|jgi:uncharacterized protein (TIGR02594 family)